MKTRYSKRVREEAALICAIAASGGGDLWSYPTVAEALELARFGKAHRLAYDAWASLIDVYDSRDVERDAEAEALIRTGWPDCP